MGLTDLLVAFVGCVERCARLKALPSCSPGLENGLIL